MSESHITKQSSDQRRTTGRTDWAWLDSLSDDEIHARAASDPDAAPPLSDEWMAHAEVVQQNKKMISIRLDADVLAFFKDNEKNYQTKMNAVLRAYVEACKKSK
mgnify:CR=1 FL=1